MKTKSFTLERITRSGRADRWRVRGTLNGERISRSFADKGQAKAFRETKEIERQNAKLRTYKDGKVHGRYTGWHENGQKKMEITFKDGTRKDWDEDGNPR